jgi:DNA-binding MarR family transcriptional regulator
MDNTPSENPEKAGAPTEHGSRPKDLSSHSTGPLARLVSMRMVALFNLMRRSMILTQRRDFNVSEIEWRIITLIGQRVNQEPISLNGLASLIVQDRGQLSRAVKAMAERDLLTRTRRSGGPEIAIGLADGGRELYARMVERAIERDRILTRGINPDEIEVVRRVVEEMILRAEALMEDALEEDAS